MTPWVGAEGVVLVALLGICLGWLFSRLKKSYWLLGCPLPFLLMALLVLTRCTNGLHFVEPFSSGAVGRTRCITLSLAVSMGLTVPLSHLCLADKINCRRYSTPIAKQTTKTEIARNADVDWN